MNEKSFIQPMLLGNNSLEEKCEDEYTIVEEREELMIPPNSEGTPTLRIAHFLKPLFNHKITSLPKPPFHSLSSNQTIKHLEKGVIFKGRLKPLKSWKPWVEILQKTHKSTWEKAGIFDAIRGSTYKILRDNELILCLAEKWCPETNTFVFSWGESTVTLEDIMILGGFSVMGNCVLTTSFNSSKFAEIEEYLVKACSMIRRKHKYQVTHKYWLEYFMGKGGEIEHVGFLVLWLSRYVLPSSSTIVAAENVVFRIAISLALGIKFALAPAVLASIYRDLTILKEMIVVWTKEGLVVESSELVVWAPFQLVQLWAWERFTALSPNPASLVHGAPRVARWHNVRKIVTRNLRLEIESDADDGFVWRPYVLCLKNWDVPKFYCGDDEGRWVVINSDSELDEGLLSFVRCLRGCELVGLNCVMQYLPHRVGMQFGMDQGIPDIVPRFDDDYKLAWSSYEKTIEGLKLYMPPRLFEGDVTVQYNRWWMQVMGVGDEPGDELLKTDSRREESCLEPPNELGDGVSVKENEVVVVDIATNTALLEQLEDVGAEKEEGKMVEKHSRSTLEDIEPSTKSCGEVVSASELGYKTNKLCSMLVKDDNHLGNETIVGKQVKQDIGQPSTKSCGEVMNGTNVLSNNEPKKSCFIPDDDRNHLGNDTIEGEKVLAVYNSPNDVEEEEDDCVKHFQEKRHMLESRMSKLERIVFMYKMAKYESMENQSSIDLVYRH